MQPNILFMWCIAVCLFLSALVEGGGGKGGEHIVFKIPYHVKTIKHTHTIYKTIHHYPKEEHHDHGHGKEFLGFGWH